MNIEEWGLIPYQDAVNRQMESVYMIAEGDMDEYIATCSHNPIVVAGQDVPESCLASWKGEVAPAHRGAGATYYSPAQLVIYPLINLSTRGRNLHQFIRKLETATIEALSEYDISAQLLDGNTGLWVGTQKIVSVNIAVKKWVAYNGLSVNVHKDPEAFKSLKPCGHAPEEVISMEELVGKPVSMEDFSKNLCQKIDSHLQITE